MNIAAFCYMGLLRFPEQLDASLTLLTEDMRQEVTTFLATIRDLPREELLRRWKKLREEEAAAVRRNAYERTGVQLDDIPPAFRGWWLNASADRNG